MVRIEQSFWHWLDSAEAWGFNSEVYSCRFGEYFFFFLAVCLFSVSTIISWPIIETEKTQDLKENTLTMYKWGDLI